MGVTLGATSVQFPVLNPGQGANPQSVTLTLTGAATQVSLAITDAPDGVFTAELIMTTLMRGGATSTVLASTSVGSATATVNPIEPGIEGSYSLQIGFTAPTVPVPGSFEGTLVVSWPDGSANVALTGTTAQLTATVLRGQPIPLKPGATASVPVQITYLSGDSTTLNVQLAIATYPAPPPAGLTVSPAQVQLPPVFFAFKPTPGSPTHEILDLGRSATVSLTASADTGAQPGTQVVYVSVSAVEFPQLNPQPVKITFDITPLPVAVSIKQRQPISIIAGQSAKVTLLVTEPGAPTLLKLGTPSTPSGVSVVLPAPPPWPAWQDREIGIGGSDTPVTAPLVITVNNSASPWPSPQDETISLPWTAYGGKSVGALPLQISLLASAAAFFSGSLTAEGATASATLLLFADGSWLYSGSIKNSEVFASNYSLGIKLNLNPPIVALRTGSVGPDLPFFSNTDSWNAQGIDPRIAERWPEILAAGNSASLSVSTNPFDAVLEILGLTVAAYYAAALIAAAAVGAGIAVVGAGTWVKNNCVVSVGIHPNGNGGIAGEVTMQCPK